MDYKPITADMTVWSIYKRYPQTLDVFFRYGCPDIRKELFPLAMRLMKLRWAARAHKVAVEDMLRDLNAVVQAPASGIRPAEPAPLSRRQRVGEPSTR